MTIANDTAFNVVELRRYQMRPGRLDDLVTIFERDFIEGQEVCGMVPIGHYRDLDDADQYVWFRGFADMESRRNALEAFYIRSEAWLQNRDAANATMVDSDNVLLLRPATPERGFDMRGLRRPGAGEISPSSLAGVAVFMLREEISTSEIARFAAQVLPGPERYARRIAMLVTEDSPNDFRLPVRAGEWALVVTGICADSDSLEEWMRSLQPSRLPAELREKLIGSEYLRLQPAARSLYR